MSDEAFFPDIQAALALVRVAGTAVTEARRNTRILQHQGNVIAAEENLRQALRQLNNLIGARLKKVAPVSSRSPEFSDTRV